jgi:hypothetical protein
MVDTVVYRNKTEKQNENYGALLKFGSLFAANVTRITTAEGDLRNESLGIAARGL